MMNKGIFSVKQESAAGRIELLDFLRGAGMILVLLHHSDMPHGDWLLAFHMPFLFVLSGYTVFLQKREYKFWNYLKNRVVRLVIPYFLFEGLNLFVWSASLIMQGGWQDLSEAIIAIIACLNTEAYIGYYGRLWFWPCMFVSDILFYIIVKIYSYFHHDILRKLSIWAFSGILLTLSWLTSKVLPFRLPFAADTALMATFFLLAGYYLGEHLTWLLEKKHILTDALLLAACLCLMRICMFSGKAFCGMYENEYGDYVYTLTAAFCGIFAFLVFVKWTYAIICRIGLGKNLILWYGRNSFVTFPIHLSIKIWMWNHIPWKYRPWYLLFLAMLLVNIPIVNLVTRYFPFMSGKFPPPKKKRQTV